MSEMNFHARTALVRNLCSKSDQMFCEAANIWGKFLNNVSEINSWDDEKRKEFDELTEVINAKFKASMEQVRDYLTDLSKDLDELEYGA